MDLYKSTRTILRFGVLLLVTCASGNATSNAVEKIVTTVKPTQTNHSQMLTLAGTVESVKNARLAVLESGVVADITVEVGDFVAEGQQLLQLNDKLAQIKRQELATLIQAKTTERDEAKRRHKEVLALSTKQLVAQTLIDERLAAIHLADAALRQAQVQLDYQDELITRHKLLSPFTGVVAKRDIDIGEWATPQSAVFNLVSHKDLRVKLEIPQEYLSLLNNKKAKVTVLPSASHLSSFSATIDRIVTIANEHSRTFSAYIDLVESHELVAGMSVNVSVVIPHMEQSVVWLPKSAIKQHPDGGTSVFAVENNRAKLYVVEIVEQGLEQMAVAGAPKNLPIITTGIALLKNGEKVRLAHDAGKVE